LNIKINDLEERYARMSEKELASIRPEDLTEVARQCHEREVSSRQAARSSATPDDPPSGTPLEGTGSGARREGTALRGTRLVANVLSVFFAFCTALVLLKDGFGLIQLFAAVLTNIFLYYLFRVPYYIIKGYTGR
jgi:hypothetical protein